MKIGKIIPLAASLAAVLMVSGCSSSGNGCVDCNATVSSVAGTAFDGPIKNAIACIDVNNNNQCDADEPQAKTDISGEFTIANPQGSTGPLVVTGGVDTGTGKPFPGTFSAPIGSTVVNPTTSAIQSLVKIGVKPDEAEKTIKKALNIPSDVTLTSFNPFKSINSNDEKSKANAQKVLTAQAKLQTIVQAVATTVAAADANTTVQNTMAIAFKHVTKVLQTATEATKEGEDVNITSTIVAKAIEDTASEKLKDNVKAQTAVILVAQNTATRAVVTADVASKKVMDANSSKDITNVFNQGIYAVNVDLNKSLSDDVSDVQTNLVDKNDIELQTLVTKITSAKTAQEKQIAQNNLISTVNVTVAPITEDAVKADVTASIENAEQAVLSAANTLISECTAQGGTYALGVCTLPTLVPTGASN